MFFTSFFTHYLSIVLGTLRTIVLVVIAASNITLSMASETASTDRTQEFFDEVEEKAEANAHYFRNFKLTLKGGDENIKQEYWNLFMGVSEPGSTAADSATDSKKQPKELATEAYCHQERLNKLVYNAIVRHEIGQLKSLPSEDRAKVSTTPVEEGILDIQDREHFWRVSWNIIRRLRVNYSEIEKNLTDPKVSKRWQGLLQRVYSEFFNYANFTLRALDHRQETLSKVRKLSEKESKHVKEVKNGIGIINVSITKADPDVLLLLCSREEFTAPLEGLSHYPIISQISNDLFDVVDIMKSIKIMLDGLVYSTVNLPAGTETEGTRSGNSELYGCNAKKSISEKIVNVTSTLVARHKLGFSRTRKGMKTPKERRKPQKLEELVLNEKESSETVEKLTKEFFELTKEFFEMIKTLPGNGKQTNKNLRKRQKAKEKAKAKAAGSSAGESAGESAGDRSAEEKGHTTPSQTTTDSSAVTDATTSSQTATDSSVITDATLPTGIKSAFVPEPALELVSPPVSKLPPVSKATLAPEKKYSVSSAGTNKKPEKAKPSVGKQPPYKLDSFAANAYQTATKLANEPVSAYDMECFVNQIGGKIEDKKFWKGSKRGMYIPNFSPEKTRDYLYVKLDFPHSARDDFNTWTLRGIFGRDLERAGIASPSFYKF